jgi:hemolysin III
MMPVLQRLFRDPVSGLMHLAGAMLGLVASTLLVYASRDMGPRAVVAMTVYGVSLVILYASSATYHLPHVSEALRLKLRRVDHAMIPVFIAGSYTPFCAIALNSTLGYTVLAIVWALTLAGLVKSLYWLHAPRWVTAGIFVVMGWVSLVAIYPLSQALTVLALSLLVLGGVAYSVGAVVYAKKWPDPWPPHFGFHEVWHLFVLAGSACHFAAIASLVPAA